MDLNQRQLSSVYNGWGTVLLYKDKYYSLSYSNARQAFSVKLEREFHRLNLDNLVEW